MVAEFCVGDKRSKTKIFSPLELEYFNLFTQVRVEKIFSFFFFFYSGNNYKNMDQKIFAPSYSQVRLRMKEGRRIKQGGV